MDDGIRLQIIGIRVETAGIFATGSLAMDYLGLVGTYSPPPPPPPLGIGGLRVRPRLAAGHS